MKHIVIGTLFALIVLLLGGCKSIVESNPAIFGNYVGKPVTGRQATYAHAAIIAQNTGDMSQLRTVWQRQNQQRQWCEPSGWSSRSTTLEWEWRQPEQPSGRFYRYMGRVYMIPARGTSAYRVYLWRTKQK